MVKPEELGKKIDPENFVVLVPAGAGNFVPLRLQFGGDKISTLAILVAADRGEDGEQAALEIVEKMQAKLAERHVAFRALKREVGNQQRTDALVIELFCS